jgi:ADP-ribosyl-[dinitrogen reductase] hydrolase
MSAPWESIEGGLWGLLVGDAAGVPYEFHAPDEIPPLSNIQMLPPEGFARSYAHVPLGTWSDDGAQALCLAASLLEHPGWNVGDFAKRLLAWSASGYMAVDGRVFDIGIQTGAALRRLAGGVPPESSGLNGERNNGNGSLMRSLPLALLWRGDDASLVRCAHEQSAVTHAHPHSQVCCALYCLWARAEMHRIPEAWDHAVEVLRSVYPAGSVHRVELEETVLPGGEATPTGSGYVVDSLHSARHACESSSYGDTVRRAIQLGNDTDTTACIAGGIAGIRHGKRDIPADWLRAFRGQDIVLALLDQISTVID